MAAAAWCWCKQHYDSPFPPFGVLHGCLGNSIFLGQTAWGTCHGRLCELMQQGADSASLHVAFMLGARNDLFQWVEVHRAKGIRLAGKEGTWYTQVERSAVHDCKIMS